MHSQSGTWQGGRGGGQAGQERQLERMRQPPPMSAELGARPAHRAAKSRLQMCARCYQAKADPAGKYSYQMTAGSVTAVMTKDKNRSRVHSEPHCSSGEVNTRARAHADTHACHSHERCHTPTHMCNDSLTLSTYFFKMLSCQQLIHILLFSGYVETVPR